MKKIAIEEHFTTKDYINYLHTRKEAPKREMIEEAGEKLEKEWWSRDNFILINPNQPYKLLDLGEGRLQDMDEVGIDMQVLSLNFPGVEPFNAANGTALAKSINDELAEVIKKYPDRFAALATVAPQDPAAAADELKRTVTKLGFKGAMINGNIQGEFLDQQKYWVIFEIAEKLDVPIYIHPRAPAVDMINPYLGYPNLALGLWGFAAEAGLHAMRLICSGVFDKYTGLKIILGHLGESLPFWLWRLDSRWPKSRKSNSMMTDKFSKPQKNPSQYIKDNFYVTTSGMFWQPVLQYVCSVMGADHVMLATDYPHEANADVRRFVESMQESNEDHEKICHLNAEKLLAL